jgi:hypothetical protein
MKIGDARSCDFIRTSRAPALVGCIKGDFPRLSARLPQQVEQNSARLQELGSLPSHIIYHIGPGILNFTVPFLAYKLRLPPYHN